MKRSTGGPTTRWGNRSHNADSARYRGVHVCRAPAQRSRWVRWYMLVVAAGVVVSALPAQAWQPMRTSYGCVLAWRGPPPKFFIYALSPWWDRIDAVAQHVIASWFELECMGLQFRPEMARHFSISLVWSFLGRPGDLAWTEVRSSAYGGIRSAHIHLNAAMITREHAPPDLNTVITHELGHALGFDHSHGRDFVMAHGIMRGNSHSYLSDDDHAGVCGIYPKDVFDLSDREAGLGWWWLLLCVFPSMSWGSKRLRRRGWRFPWER